MDESSPLLADTSSGVITPVLPHEQSFRLHLTRTQSIDLPNGRRTLNTFAGVFSPVALSMFSTLLFLRIGLLVGQSGLILSLLQLVLAYLIIYMTILSICAISTNGAIEGGGAYYMISRALGPEFGGSIGILFFLANIVSCALYISGFVEGMLDNFSSGGNLVSGDGMPSSRWWNYLYCSAVLVFCLFICLIGGAMFARTSVFILAVLCVCVLTVIGSMLFIGGMTVEYPHNNPFHPATNSSNDTRPPLNYTGLSAQTFRDNIKSGFTTDYLSSSHDKMSFATVFAVLFSSVTGILNGANMSGELKEPGKAIPRGTLGAALFTFLTYVIITFLTSATSTRLLLVNNYTFLQPINVWPPFIVIGIFAATLSAALGNLIGASRILEALARDELFWKALYPATITSRRGNPYMAVFISWVLVQLVLLIGSLNAIAPISSELFLLSYASTNLACLALELASAPNFRPTFTFFSWHTCVLGLVGCVVMCFVINVIYACVSIVVCMVLVIVLHLRSFSQDWGSISQALIFHQVRKYLLMLDSRKDHIKFWRPQMLLMVSNPRGCCGLIDFINDIKKGGLYVLGNVMVGSLDASPHDPCHARHVCWLKLLDSLRIKAFVEVTLSGSVREGLQHLVRVSGIGGMKPNTICLGFYDDARPIEDMSSVRRGRQMRVRRFFGRDDWDGDNALQDFPSLRQTNADKNVSKEEYISMIRDVFKMSKNICIFRHFQMLNKEQLFQGKGHFIDVWPVNLFQPESANYFDNSCLFMLQLACILHMVPGWKSSTNLRVFMCVESSHEATARKQQKLSDILHQLRIPGVICPVSIQHAAGHLSGDSMPPDQDVLSKPLINLSGQDTCLPDEDGLPQPSINSSYLDTLNQVIREHCLHTAVCFLYLPRVPQRPRVRELYLRQLELLSDGLPPTVFVHGVHPVTSTTL